MSSEGDLTSLDAAAPPAEDTFTGFTDSQKVILQATWKRLIGNTPKDFKIAGINLLLWMFDNVPDMRLRFTRFSAQSSRADLIEDEMFLAHTQAVLLYMDSLINALQEPQKLETKMRAICVSHLNQTPSIGNEYFRTFQEKFHIFLGSSLGLCEEDERVKLFTAFLDLFCRLIVDEQEKLKQAVPQEKSNKDCCSIV